MRESNEERTEGGINIIPISTYINNKLNKQALETGQLEVGISQGSPGKANCLTNAYTEGPLGKKPAKEYDHKITVTRRKTLLPSPGFTGQFSLSKENVQ